MSEFLTTMSVLRCCAEPDRAPPADVDPCPVCKASLRTINWDAGHQDICGGCYYEAPKVEWSS